MPRFGPWLWSPLADCLVFGGSACLALALVVLGHVFGFARGELPDWGFLAFVVAVDVAHVYGTLFRTYFDADEIHAHRARYFALPIAAYASGVLLYTLGAAQFWRILAYLAVFHFVRQQAGWVALYRARAGARESADVFWDNAASYAASLYPLLEWHARLADTRFAWFVRGDFVDLSVICARFCPYARAFWLAALLGFCGRQLQVYFRRRTFQLGKVLVVFTTAATWYVGIVLTNSDFDFTVTNVITHGVPYLMLLWRYACQRRLERPRILASRLLAAGLAGFLGVVVSFAFVEELIWDRLVWNERARLFGTSDITLGHGELSWIVPLLALPQIVHYLLDGLLWKRRDTRRLPAQRRALGFDSAHSYRSA